MKLLLGVLYTVVSAVALLGQTWMSGLGAESQTANAGAAWVEQLRSLPKRYPPEQLTTSADPNPAKESSSYLCTYPALDTKSVSIKRCQPTILRFPLVAPLKRVASESKPAK